MPKLPRLTAEEAERMLLARYDLLFIDELGYLTLKPEQVPSDSILIMFWSPLWSLLVFERELPLWKRSKQIAVTICKIHHLRKFSRRQILGKGGNAKVKILMFPLVPEAQSVQLLCPPLWVPGKPAPGLPDLKAPSSEQAEP